MEQFGMMEILHQNINYEEQFCSVNFRFGTFSTVQDLTSGQERIFIWLCGNGDILLAMPLAMIPPSYFIHLGRFKSY